MSGTRNTESLRITIIYTDAGWSTEVEMPDGKLFRGGMRMEIDESGPTGCFKGSPDSPELPECVQEILEASGHEDISKFLRYDWEG